MQRFKAKIDGVLLISFPLTSKSKRSKAPLNEIAAFWSLFRADFENENAVFVAIAPFSNVKNTGQTSITLKGACYSPRSKNLLRM